MRKPFFSRNGRIALMLLAGALAGSCNSDDGDNTIGNWVTSTVFDGSPRSSVTGFTIGNYGYAGTGYDGDNYLKDFWRYNIDGGYWEQKADFPGKARSSAVAFSIGDNGYIGTGYDGTDELADFYKYDTNSDTWTPIANFSGTARRAAVAFNSDTYGYVGSGFDGDNDKKDFWRYNPITDAWEEQFGFGGNKRREGLTFTIGTKVYFGTGSSNGINQNDFWVFDTTSETWTRLTDLNDKDSYTVKRTNATGFSVGNYGYVCGGDVTSVWEYNPSTDKWKQKTDFEGSARQDALSLYNGSKAFILLGKYGNTYYDDMFEFEPFEKLDEDD